MEVINREEACSPTSHIESIFCRAVIDAMESKDVAVVDLPNAFIQTDLIKHSKAVKVIMVIIDR